MRDSSRNEKCDSANMQAARELRLLRLESGLTQEQIAAQSGYDTSTVVRREHGVVDLGPLRQSVLLRRARDAKLKGPK